MKNSLDLDLVVHVPECCPLKSNADERCITLQIVLLCIGLNSQLLANGYRSLDLANPLLFLVLELVFQLCTGLFVSGVWKPCQRVLFVVIVETLTSFMQRTLRS